MALIHSTGEMCRDEWPANQRPNWSALQRHCQTFNWCRSLQLVPSPLLGPVDQSRVLHRSLLKSLPTSSISLSFFFFFCSLSLCAQQRPSTAVCAHSVASASSVHRLQPQPAPRRMCTTISCLLLLLVGRRRPHRPTFAHRVAVSRLTLAPPVAFRQFTRVDPPTIPVHHHFAFLSTFLAIAVSSSNSICIWHQST